MASSSSSGVTPEDENCIITKLGLAADASSKEGDTFFMLNPRWWREWNKYCGHFIATKAIANIGGPSSKMRRPSTIDNSHMINQAVESVPDIELHDNLVEGRDYILIPETAWNQLHAWYGGGPTLARKVIQYNNELYIEVYPLRLHLHLTPKSGKSTIRISKMETVGGLYKRAMDVFHLSQEQILIWDYYQLSKLVVLNEMEKTLVDANIQLDQDILVEIIDHGKQPGKIIVGSDDTQVFEIDNFTSHGREPSTNTATDGASVGQFPGGLIGMKNLGNTCYLNSAVQCLVHTPGFSTHFLEDIHQQNPSGKAGKLTLAFGELLKKLWKPRRTSVAPSAFKNKLSKFAPSFDGCDEHDSQELLVILLDGLHENLNRVKCQPHTILREANGRSDEDIADEHWSNYKARNDSLIVDIFQGQYKSTLVCPICNKGSSTFDPFMYLSLPIATTNSRSMTITVFTSDGSAPPSVYLVSVPKRGRCKDLIQAIANVCSLKRDEKLLLAQIRTHLIDRFLDDPLMTLSSIKDDDIIVAYKIPKNTTNQKFLQLIHRVEDRQNGNATRWKPFGIPLISPISCNEVMMRSDVQLIVHTVLSPMSRTINGEKHNNGVVTANQPKLPLQLVDENNSCIDLSALQTEFIKFSSSSEVMIVFVDWSEKLLEEYDMSCWGNLPRLGKYGLVTKKDRIEHHLSLYTCLEGYLCEEPLTPNEHMWYCPRCEAQRQASKKLDLWRLPEVLIFHLKRFSSPTKKLETFVDFPLNDLDLTNYVPNKTSSLPQRYELYALVNHHGNMASGHYHAHIKMQDENRWYNFDDKHVTPISEEEVKSAGAYVLFYKRIKDDDACTSNATPFSAGHNAISFCQ